jgi:hypothetical protein
VTPFRCTLAARARSDDVLATAPPARRFFLLEVPGPWGTPDALAASGLRHDVAETIRHHAGRAAARVLLIRRPGRHPAPGPGAPKRWAVVRLGRAGPAGSVTGTVPGSVTWGSWADDDDLLRIDPVVPGPRVSGPPLALVCTHSRHDQCCAIEGRPVAARAAADPRVDVWECSHLGGDRFAANVLWLPSGYLLGGLTADTTAATVAAALDGRVLLEQFRGRCGDPAAAQAAQWFAMRELGTDRPDEVAVESLHNLPPAREGAEPHAVAVVRHDDRRLRVELAPHWGDPHQLTCRGPHGARARTWRLVASDVLAAAS